VEDVGLIPADDLIPTLGVRQHADQIPLRARCDQNCGFFPHALGGQLLQAIHRRVFVKDVVAQLGLIDRPAHLWRRQGDGIAAQIDHAFGHPRSPIPLG